MFCQNVERHGRSDFATKYLTKEKGANGNTYLVCEGCSSLCQKCEICLMRIMGTMVCGRVICVDCLVAATQKTEDFVESNPHKKIKK